MAWAIWQRTIVDDSGNVLNGASVEVRSEATGSLATLKSARDGSSGKSNPFTVGSDGFAQFYARAGAYQIVVTLGGFSKTWRYEPIGMMAELDISPHFGGRLTAQSGVPITESDSAAATVIYATPFGQQSGMVNLYDGDSWRSYDFTEMTLTLDSNSGHSGYHQADKNFDVFMFDNAGTLVIGTGPAWSSDSSRGTGAGTTEVELVKGALVNKVLMTIRNGSSTYSVAARCGLLLGSFRASANGQTDDSLVKRFVSNVFNAVPRCLYKTDNAAGSGWVYSTASYQQANNNAANQLDWLHTIAGRMVEVTLYDEVQSDTANMYLTADIGLDSITLSASKNRGNVRITAANIVFVIHAKYIGLPGIGRHRATWLEKGGGSGVQVWIGSNVVGLTGWTPN